MVGGLSNSNSNGLFYGLRKEITSEQLNHASCRMNKKLIVIYSQHSYFKLYMY